MKNAILRCTCLPEPFKTHLFTKSEKSYIVLASGETTCAPQPAGPETTYHSIRTLMTT